MDFRNDSDLMDINTIIYGHNMKNDKMEKIKDKLENIKLEVLFMIVLLAIFLLAGIAIFGASTKGELYHSGARK